MAMFDDIGDLEEHICHVGFEEGEDGNGQVCIWWAWSSVF